MNSFTPLEMMEIMSSIETINKFMNKFMILQKSKKLICTLKNFYMPARCLRDSYIAFFTPSRAPEYHYCSVKRTLSLFFFKRTLIHILFVITLYVKHCDNNTF